MPGNLAIIAGRGALPKELASGAQAMGRRIILVGIEGEHEPWIENFDHVVVGWGQFGQLFKALKKYDISEMVLAGGVVRPKVKLLKMDWVAYRSLPEILAFMIGGDNSLLSGVIRLFEKRGIRVVGAHDVVPDLLAKKGLICGKKPPRKAMSNLKIAFKATKELGRLDIGQACVAVGGRVVSVEGIEGTDDMLERVTKLREEERLYENGRFGVLVKTAKPGQELRVDLPTIGPDTIRNIHKAGLRGIGIEAGSSIILERETTFQLASEYDVFVMGITSELMDE